MIIQIRGTSGSGKSTVMRQVMERLGQWEEERVPGRKQPLFYSNKQDIVVLGHYNSACGGCDTIGSAAAVFDLISRLEGGSYHGNQRKILCEGLLLSEDVKWSSQLEDLRVIFLTTPLETCIQQIKGRREAAGNDKPLNELNTRNRVATIERARTKLIEKGVRCVRCSSTQAVDLILKWIGES